MVWTTGPGPLRVPGQARETSGHLDALCCQGWQNLPDAGQEHGWWWDHGRTLGSAPMHVCTHPGLGRQRMTLEGRKMGPWLGSMAWGFQNCATVGTRLGLWKGKREGSGGTGCRKCGGKAFVPQKVVPGGHPCNGRALPSHQPFWWWRFMPGRFPHGRCAVMLFQHTWAPRAMSHTPFIFLHCVLPCLGR